MSALERFSAYAQAFELTYADDDWQRLERYFAPDAVYRVENVPFACELRGRDNIFAGIRKSLNGMDRRFKERRIELTGKPAEDGATATVPWAVTYLRPGAPELRIAGRSTAELEGEQIVRLTDRFEDGIAESAGAWLRQHGADVDPSYE